MRALLRPRRRRVEQSPAAEAARFIPPSDHPREASAADIFYCFRLLLGRAPHPEEWPGHSSRAGEDLENVVRSYLTSREFADRGLLTPRPSRLELVRFPEFSIFASVDDLAVGNHVVIGRAYEPAVAAVLRRHVKPGMAVVDVGANIGYLTMLLAALVTPQGRVVAIEPNPDNVRMLEASRRVNGFGHVLVIQAAAGRGTALLTLHVSYSNGMTGEMPDDVEAVLASRPVPCFALDTILPAAPAIDLVKIDVEGGELNVLLGLSRTLERDRPIVVSEFTPGAMPGMSQCTGPQYLDWLTSRGYRIAVIERDGSETPYGDDVGAVMDAFGRSGVEHIDLIAAPA